MPTYRSRAELSVDGSIRQIYTASASFSMATGIATMNAAIESIAGGQVTPGEPVALALGLDNVVRPVFTGEVEEESQDYYPQGIEFPAVGMLHRARKKTNHVDTSWPGAEPDPDLPTPPKLAYYAVGATDIEHVAALLELAGITDYDLEGTGEIVGEINPVTLPTGGSPWALIQEIDRFTWHRTFDGPDGRVLRRPFSILPSSGAAMTLTEGIDLERGRRVRSRSGMIANVHVVGTSYMGADDWPIVIEFATDNPAENEYGINDVLEYQSELFETEEQAEAWAATAMGEYGVLQVRYQFNLIRGFSDLRAGMTVEIVSPRYGLGSGSRFLVESVRHSTDGTEYLTSIEVRGAAVPDATSANQKPVPVVVMSIHREYLDGEYVDTVGLDASGSYDPDGPAIGAFVWSGDPVDPVPIGDGQRATVTYEGGIDAQTPNPPTVTLAVTDLMGATASRTFPVRATAGMPIQTRDLWIAAGSELLHSPNGGVTWDTYAVAAVGCVREVAEYQLAWEASGALYKVRLGIAPVLLTPTNITAAWVSYRVGDEFTGVCYAAGSDGKVWRSIDEGVSWVEITATPLPATITTISESPYAEGELQLTSGDKLYRSFDAGANWSMLHEYGDDDMTAEDFAAGFGKGLIGYSGSDTSESHIQERENAITVTFPSGHNDAQIAAITISGSESTFWVLSSEAPGDGNSWQGDLLAGGELVEKAYDNAYGAPAERGMIRDPKVEGLIYFAQNSAVSKTLTGFDDTRLVKLLTGGQVGWGLGIGPLRAFAAPAGNVVWVGASATGTGARYVYRLDGAGFTRTTHPLNGGAPANIAMIVTTDGSLITWAHDSALVGRNYIGDDNCYRSTDGGINWTLLPIQRVYDVKAGPDGVVYAIMQDIAAVNAFGVHHLARSDNNGASWSTVHSIGPSATIVQMFSALQVSPADPDVVLYHAYRGSGNIGYFLSTDGGATFANTGVVSGDQAGLERGSYVGISPAGTHFYWHPQQALNQPFRRAILDTSGTTAGTSGMPDENDPQPNIVHAGIGYQYGNQGVFGSEDNGATWDVVLDATNAPNPAFFAVTSFVPGDSSNDWYAFGVGGGTPPALMRRLATALPGDVWEDLTPGLLVAFPDVQYYAFRESAVRLPGEV